MLKDLDKCPFGFTYSLGLSLHLKPLILWNSLVLLLKVPNKGLTLSSGPERHIVWGYHLEQVRDLSVADWTKQVWLA